MVDEVGCRRNTTDHDVDALLMSVAIPLYHFMACFLQFCGDFSDHALDGRMDFDDAVVDEQTNDQRPRLHLPVRFFPPRQRVDFGI